MSQLYPCACFYQHGNSPRAQCLFSTSADNDADVPGNSLLQLSPILQLGLQHSVLELLETSGGSHCLTYLGTSSRDGAVPSLQISPSRRPGDPVTTELKRRFNLNGMTSANVFG